MNASSLSDALNANNWQPFMRTERLVSNQKDCLKPTLLSNRDIHCLCATFFVGLVDNYGRWVMDDGLLDSLISGEPDDG
jgi:hypothetical protein